MWLDWNGNGLSERALALALALTRLVPSYLVDAMYSTRNTERSAHICTPTPPKLYIHIHTPNLTHRTAQRRAKIKPVANFISYHIITIPAPSRKNHTWIPHPPFSFSFSNTHTHKGHEYNQHPPFLHLQVQVRIHDPIDPVGSEEPQTHKLSYHRPYSKKGMSVSCPAPPLHREAYTQSPSGTKTGKRVDAIRRDGNPGRRTKRLTTTRVQGLRISSSLEFRRIRGRRRP